jgi:hypothetical protein
MLADSDSYLRFEAEDRHDDHTTTNFTITSPSFSFPRYRHLHFHHNTHSTTSKFRDSMSHTLPGHKLERSPSARHKTAYIAAGRILDIFHSIPLEAAAKSLARPIRTHTTMVPTASIFFFFLFSYTTN